MLPKIAPKLPQKACSETSKTYQIAVQYEISCPNPGRVLGCYKIITLFVS